MVPDTIFSPIQEEPKHDNKSNFEEGEIQSEDPFHIYDLLVKKHKNDNKEEERSKATLKYPLGFTLDDVLRTKDVQDVDDVVEVQENTQKSLAQKAKKDWVKELCNKNKNLRVQNVGNQNGLIGVQGNGNQNQIGNEEYDLMAAAADLDVIEEVNANCILMANLQQA
nr:hypothetical protein [Tanacetum cinerariifolium]